MGTTKINIQWYPKGDNGYFGISQRGVRYRIWKSSVTGEYFASNKLEVFRGDSLNHLIKKCECLENEST